MKAATLISFDLKADFGVLKKPDVNEGLQLTFNMLHKPALLGILGAIAGLEGYQRKGELPAYYLALKGLKTGIMPLPPHEKGNFTKTVIKYTNGVGYAIKAGESHYIPYIGKNECTAWWDKDEVREYEYATEAPQQSFAIGSVFCKDKVSVKDEKEEDDATGFWDFEPKPDKFIYLERLPIAFDEWLMQYQLANFAYTNFKLKHTADLDGLYFIPQLQEYVQLF
jgi:CRISPR-associated protein Cas5h